MRYEAVSNGAAAPYPSASIDPKKKDDKYIAQYGRAMFSDFSFGVPKGIFANNGGDYEKYRMYSLGMQPNSQYKKWSGVDEQTNNTWLSNDWSIRAIVSTYRDKALSRCMKQRHGIVATPVDMLAKSEMQEFYAKMRIKLMMREQLQKAGNQELANHPRVAIEAGEPEDVEELEMRLNMNEQFNRSKDAELAVALAFTNNDFETVRQTWFQDEFDLGPAGYKEWLGEDNKPKFRACNPENVITSFTRDRFFRDIVHAGELIDVSLVDLALLADKDGNRKYSDEKLQEFAGTIAGKWGNPMSVGAGGAMSKPYDKFKCRVLDFEFLTYDDYVYYMAADENGNLDFRRAAYDRGKTSDKYTRKRIQMKYVGKWIVGTDECYDCGPASDQKRSNDPKKKAYTELSFRFCATHFYEMKAQGMMKRLIPYLDDYQMTRQKIQNFKNRAVPSGWWIDLDALENVALNKGGKNMEPKELLQMFYETGVLVGRSKDVDGNPMGPNWKPVIPIENTVMAELAGFYNDLVMTIQEIERMTGYNDITSGNPNPKTLNAGYENANESTNDALYPMVSGVTYLTQKLAEDVLRRTQQALRKGDVEGYATSLNTNTIQALSISKEICDREYGIMLLEQTTDEQKSWLYQMMQADIMNGFLDSSDAVTLVNTHNVKQAQMIWAYRVKKAKQAIQDQKMKELQLTNDGMAQQAQIAQQATAQQLLMEYDLKAKLRQMELESMERIEMMKVQSMEKIAFYSNNTKLQVAGADHDGKVVSAETQAQAKLVSTQVQGEYSLAKQEIANAKPPTPSGTKK